MSSSKYIVDKFGGPAALAKLISKPQSTISYWIKAGSIPSKWQSILLSLAQTKEISLSTADFFKSEDKNTEQTVEEIGPKIPKATHWGDLSIGGHSIPSYVLDTGQRVFSLKGVVVGLIGTEGGQLAEYLKVKILKNFLPSDLSPADDGSISVLIKFDTGAQGSVAKFAIGFPVERFIDLCVAYSEALQAHAAKTGIELTSRQIEIAIRANAFLKATAKTGIISLVDECTGYQYDRAQDALRLKYKLFLEEEMRKWEKTFPDQLWVEFGRLTNWDGPVHLKPKYWGKLIMELIYGYLDPDVAKWLKENAPKPIHGQNYHQWLSSQFGLKRLTEHIWMIIGMASTCQTMSDLRRKVGEKFGKYPVQLTFYLDP